MDNDNQEAAYQAGVRAKASGKDFGEAVTAWLDTPDFIAAAFFQGWYGFPFYPHHQSGVILQCKECGWYGDSSFTHMTSEGAESCPRCDGSDLHIRKKINV